MRRLVGENFARLRKARGLTQEQVSERSGFSQQYLSGLEKGQGQILGQGFPVCERKPVFRDNRLPKIQ